MKIAVAAEAVSFPLLEMIKDHLLTKGHEVLDLGMQKPEEPLFFMKQRPG